jgi:hypothetical protein
MRIGQLYMGGLVAAVALSTGLPSSAPAQSGGEFPGWNLGYKLPPGWFVRQTVGRVHVLGSQGEAGAIFVAPGLYENVDDVLTGMGAFSRLARISGRPTEGPTDTTLAGLPAVLASFSGESEYGRPVATRLAGVFTPYGTGILVLGVAAPAAFPGMQSTVESLAATVVARAPEVNVQAARDLTGLFLRFRDGQPPSPDPERDEMRSVEETIEFEEGGDFVWKSSIYLAAEARGRADDPNITGGESDRGVYRVIGGILVLKGQQSQRVYELSQSDDRLSLDGATYYRRR